VSYRFLPWVRRGLAAEVPDADGLGAKMPARARLPVRLTLAHGPQVPIELQLYGPGDVTGLDTRAIVRTEPRPGTTNFVPDQFAAIEFDPPDLPWLLSPAQAGTNDRLRPWLALVVVAPQPGVEIDVQPGRPLPRLKIEAPASAATELPDLAESWAWAHVHMVEADGGGDVPAALAAAPDLNVSRLLCPRRLEPERDYIACLVPTTEAGRRAGLGHEPAGGDTTGPAWSGGGAAILPLYYHWSFRTGPAGDFESLARRLVPRRAAGTVGRRPMFVGAADPALPALAHDAGGVVQLEGALRAPDGDAESAPAPAMVEGLVELLDAPSEHLGEGTPPEAEPVGPPIYGRWPARRHTVPASQPRWLRELNVDPRHRAAAGLGAEVVRANQERYVDAAWRQVGEVLAANRLRDLARLMLRVGERVHSRHVAPLAVDAVFSLAAPVHHRIPIGGGVLEGTLDTSMLPAGTLDPGFRRMAAPRGQVLRRAARLAGEAPIASPTVVSTLARGELRLDVLSLNPDGVVASRLLEELPTGAGGEVSGAALGLPGKAPVQMMEAAVGALGALEARPAGGIILRPNLGISGMITEAQLERARAVTAPGRSLHGTLQMVVEHAVRPAEGGPPPVAAVEQPESLPAALDAMATAFEAQFRDPGVTSVRPPPTAVELAAMHSGVVAALDPVPVIKLRASGRLRVGGEPPGEQDLGDRLRLTQDLGPVMAGPLLPEALYRDLAALDQDRLLPGTGQIPADTVTVLETNPRFVEAFLIGANHEMNRELLWRRYPTDRRGTPFRRFWERLDGQADIGPIHEFASGARLGANATGQLEGSLVLLVRGELLRRYPNSVVYAVPAGADGRLDPTIPIELPVFAGRLEPDLTFVGFDLTEEQVAPAPGWFFVIQEQPTEPRFGLDAPDGGGTVPPHWGELDWGHVGVDPGGHLRLADTTLEGTTLPLAVRPGGVGVGSASFAHNAAHMAAITFQRPFRAAIHSAKVLEAVADPEAPG